MGTAGARIREAAPAASEASGLAVWAERSGRRRAEDRAGGGLRFAFYGRVSTEDWQDPVTSRVRRLRRPAGPVSSRWSGIDIQTQATPEDVTGYLRDQQLTLTYDPAARTLRAGTSQAAQAIPLKASRLRTRAVRYPGRRSQ